MCPAGPPFLGGIQPLAREWDDANVLAGQTPRASLAAQIESLQAVRRKAQDVAAPDCAAAVKRALVESMEATITGYIAFLGKKPNTEVDAAFTTAGQRMQTFTAELGRLSGIEPTAVTVPTSAPTAAPPTQIPPGAVTMEYHRNTPVFAGPGTEYPLLKEFYNPRTITILSKRTVGGQPWYRVQIGDIEGWAPILGLAADVVRAVPEDTSDLPPTPTP
jgi:hypothetical protein